MKTKIIQRILQSFTARQPRSVLECGSPLPLFGRGTPIHSGRALPHSKTWRSFAAVLALLVLLNSQSSTASAQNIFVANYVGGTVSEFDPSGNLITNSFAPGLNYPYGLAFDRSGNLYVGNTDNNTVSEFNSGGTLVNASFASGLTYPTGLAFDRSGNLYAANTDNNTVSEFNSGGNLIRTISDPGLSTPYGLAFDGSGNLYVANYYGDTVSEFDSGGNLITGSFASGLNYPTGLACDSSNNLFVVDYGNSTVSEFNSSGSLIRTISGPGVNSPLLIAISPAPAQPAPAPPLGITMVGNLPVVVWPAAATNYVLQMTTNLASGNWVTVTNGIPFSGLQITNAPPGAAFFRLH
jgi:sugar lactone lactonase YvrE